MRVEKYGFIPNSLGIPSKASFVSKIKNKADILKIAAFAKNEGLPLIPLGDGTNIAPREFVEAVIAIIDFKKIKFENDTVTAGAGINWDDLVSLSISKRFSGLEALSSIPGKVGAAPIQNIGAYGSQISDCLERVEVYNTEVEEFLFLNKEQCEFKYRDSIFKRIPGKFIVTSVILNLSRKKPQIPNYKDVKIYFENNENKNPNLSEIREAITEIRRNKLPDYKKIPNAGSFFKNPVLELEKVNEIKKMLPEIPIYPFGNKEKISAGYLIEKAGLKGKKLGSVEIYKNNALVLTNPNKASYSEIIAAKNLIERRVWDKFGVTLEPEVNLI